MLTTISMASEPGDSTISKLKTNASISLNSNGIATIPAFSLDKPAVIASLSLAKGRLSYDPMLAYGLDRRPWFIDNWIHYKIIDRPSFELVTGMNISMYFSNTGISDDIILKGERYFALAIKGTYRISPDNSLSFSYWNDRGQDAGTLKGHYLSLTGEMNNIGIGEHLIFGWNVQLFYINYDGNNDGLFVSPTISSSYRGLPISIFWQATQPVSTNIQPSPVFKWNIGISYSL
jgi:hypothetical protein